MLGVAPSTEDFVEKAATSDMFEVGSSRFAVEGSDEAQPAFAASEQVKPRPRLPPASHFHDYNRRRILGSGTVSLRRIGASNRPDTLWSAYSTLPAGPLPSSGSSAVMNMKFLASLSVTCGGHGGTFGSV